MAKELDNKRMWESIITDFKSQYATESLIYAAIINALKKQGFEYKDGEIVSIEHKPKFKIGDKIKCVRNQERYSDNDDTIAEIRCVMADKYIFTDSTFLWIDLQDDWELVKPELIHQDVTKKSDQLTGFERCVKKWLGFNSTQPNEEDMSMIVKASKELLSIARKQIASELKHYIDDAPRGMVLKEYIDGLEDALEAIEKG